MSRADVLIEAEELRARLDELIIVDVGPRELDRRLGVAGAQAVDLGDAFAGAPGGVRGNRPLPEIEKLQAEVRRWGADNGDEIVLYDDRGGLNAARGWWTLKWAGLPRVRLLNGGFQAALAAGVPTATLARVDKAGLATLAADSLPVLDADGAAARAALGKLLDARGADVFAGDPATGSGGHIPGALSRPASESLDAHGCFLPDGDLRAGLARFLAADDLGVSCGAGVSAAHLAASLAILGVTPALYVGSWSAWRADPARPVEYGLLQPA